jgi:MoaA/NifB/PqqE/SkfB family radical SAM enzyme
VEVEACLLNACNLRCRYCRMPSVPSSQLTTEQWRPVIRRLAALGTLRFKFHGGEPTLRKDFRALCAEARSTGMITAAVSNGLTIPSQPELLDYLDELIVSLDSPHRESNDSVRGCGSHEGAVEAIQIAQRRGVRAYVNMVLTRHNLGDLDAMLAFCEAREIGVNAQPVVFGRGPYEDHLSDLALSDDEIRAVHRRLVAWKRQGRALLFSAAAYQKVLDWPDLQVLTVPSPGVSSCVCGTDYIRIEANGDVGPCCQYEADFTPMNVLRDGLEPALRHARHHNCGDCWLPYYTERMELFKFRPSVVWNNLRRS